MKGYILNRAELIFHIICHKKIFYKAIKIALVVGIILNLINQGEYLIHLDFSNINFFKVGLTFLVPFCVSAYTAISMKMKYHVGENAMLSATLVCETCKNIHKVNKNTIIPFCPNCKDKTAWKIKDIKEDSVNCRD